MVVVRYIQNHDRFAKVLFPLLIGVGFDDADCCR